MPRGKPKENPRSFRLSTEALEALARLQARRGGQGAAAVIGQVLVAADEAEQRVSLEERVARLEARLGRGGGAE